MSNNLVIFPEKDFLNSESNNLFIDQFCFDSFKDKSFKNFVINNSTNLKSERMQSYELVNKIFYKILNILKPILNDINEVNYDTKCYEILLGAWLRKFIQQTLLKFKLLNHATNDHKIDSVKIFDTKDYLFVTSETQTIQNATIDKNWNAQMYSELINYFNFGIKEIQIKNNNKNFFEDNNFLFYKKKKLSIKEFSFKILTIISKFIPNSSNILIYDTGMPKKIEGLLGLKFSSIPRLYVKGYEIKYSNYNCDLREKILNYLKKNISKNKSIENFILSIIHKSLPRSFLEDFQNIRKLTKKMYFPKNPSFILTSYAFENNEIFKSYVAQMKAINKNLKYIIYQHGGSYITRIDNRYNNEFISADKFITWGKQTDNIWNNNFSFKNFKILNKSNYLLKNPKKLLVVVRSSGYNAVPYDRYNEGKRQLSSIKSFLNNLDEEIQKKTIIRGHSSNKTKDYDNISKYIKIDYGKLNYFDLLSNSKVVIFNYDSTGMLETLSNNIPTMCLIPNYEEHLNDLSVNHYKLLSKANILFKDYNKLVNHFSYVWKDINSWWYDNNVQNIINEFCELYSSKPSKNFTKELKNIILK